MARVTKLDQKTAFAILKSFKQTNEIDTPYKGIEVSNVSYVDKDGNPFKYEQSGEEYAIVNLKAQTEYKRKEAIVALKEGRLQDACNTNLSVNMLVSELEDSPIVKGQLGTLILRNVELKDEEGNPTGDTAILGKTFVPMEAKTADIFDFEAELAKAMQDEPAIKA